MSSLQKNNSLEVLKPKYISKNIIGEIKTNVITDIFNKNSKEKLL